MKKWLLFGFCIFLSVPLFSHEQISTKFLTDANVKKELKLLFKRSSAGKEKFSNHKITEQIQQNLQQPFSADGFTFSKPIIGADVSRGNAEYPWQLVVFLADRDRPLTETLNQLRYRVKQGTLVQASLLVTPRVYDKDPLKVEQMYFIYNDGTQPVIEHFQADHLQNTQELLSTLVNYMEEDTANLYTGVIVDAHGNGESMVYKKRQQETYFSVEQLLEPFREKDMKVDLLVLDSCKMSSFFSLYYLTKAARVEYLVASSDIMYATSEVMYYHILRFLDYQPKEAAIRAVRYRPRFLQLNPSMHTTNAGVLDLKRLREPLKEWTGEYYAVFHSMPEMDRELKKWFSQEDTLRSFSRTVSLQKKYVEENADKIGSSCNRETIRQEFLQASTALLDALSESTLTQWCYSPKANRLFWERIPNNDCLESVSVDKGQLDLVLETNANELSDYARKYICRFR